MAIGPHGRDLDGNIKTVFITGGSGFVAPHLLRSIDPSCAVILHVRDPSKIVNIPARAGLRVISGPLSKQDICDKLPETCDAVVHLAGAVDADETSSVIDSNVVTTRNVLDVMESKNIAKLIFMSTAAVWSGSTASTLSEAVKAHPTTIYGFAKLSAERLIADAITQGRIASAVVLRCNNTYGPGGFQGVVANFMHRLLRGQPVQIQGDGQQLREPLYISDLVELILKSFGRDRGLHTYGISGPTRVTISSIAETLASILEVNLNIEWQPENQERARHILIDIQKARTELNWNPTIGFEQGCRMYAAQVRR